MKACSECHHPFFWHGENGCEMTGPDWACLCTELPQSSLDLDGEPWSVDVDVKGERL